MNKPWPIIGQITWWYFCFLQQREIDAILCGQLTQDEEDDVLKELEELVEADSSHVKTEMPELPNVPTDQLPSSKVETKVSKEKVALEAF